MDVQPINNYRGVNETFWKTILAAALCYVAWLVYKKLILKDGRIEKYLKAIPTPPEFPILKNSYMFLVKDTEIIDRTVRHYKKIGETGRMCLWIGNKPMVALMSPQDIEKVLSSRDAFYLHKGQEYHYGEPFIGAGLIISSGEKSLARRKSITPAFHFQILEQFAPLFNETSRVLTEVLQKYSDGGPFKISDYTEKFTFDALCESSLGKKLDSLKMSDNMPYIKSIHMLLSLTMTRILNPFYQNEIVWVLSGAKRKMTHHVKIINQFIYDVLASKKHARKLTAAAASSTSTQERKEESESGYFGKNKKAFLDCLLDITDSNGTSLADEDVIAELKTIAFAGQDTTATGLAWTINLLGEHTEWQDAIREEIREVLKDDPDRDIGTSDLSKLKTLEYCIKESMRLFPPVFLFSRELRKDITMNDGITLPNGANVLFIPYLTHRDPRLFKNPHTFDPTRFEPDNCLNRHPYSYIPFSAGPRNCIGQKYAMNQMKIVMAHLVRSFKIHSVKKSEEVAKVADIIGRPKDGIFVKIAKIL